MVSQFSSVQTKQLPIARHQTAIPMGQHLECNIFKHAFNLPLNMRTPNLQLTAQQFSTVSMPITIGIHPHLSSSQQCHKHHACTSSHNVTFIVNKDKKIKLMKNEHTRGITWNSYNLFTYIGSSFSTIEFKQVSNRNRFYDSWILAIMFERDLVERRHDWVCCLTDLQINVCLP